MVMNPNQNQSSAKPTLKTEQSGNQDSSLVLSKRNNKVSILIIGVGIDIVITIVINIAMIISYLQHGGNLSWILFGLLIDGPLWFLTLLIPSLGIAVFVRHWLDKKSTKSSS